MIEGVYIKKLAMFLDERGHVLHMLRVNDPYFKKFGEIYFSFINPGVVKGWKYHLKITQHFAVPVGTIKLVLFDDRESSTTQNQIQEIELGFDNYHLVCIPPKIWYGFKPMTKHGALIANCTDYPHDPKESLSINLNDARIPFKWE